MHFFSSRRTVRRYRNFVISALLHLTGIVDCSSSKIFSPDSNVLATYEMLPVYCDEKYQAKYSHPDFHATSPAGGKFVPHTGLSEDIDWGPDDEQQVELGEASKFGYDSEFLSTKDKSGEFLTHDEDESSEFIVNRGELRSFGRNFVPFVWNCTENSEVHDLEDNADTGRRFLRNGGEEIGKVKRYAVREIRVTFGGDPSRLKKKLSSPLRYRKSNRKFDREGVTSVKPYNVADTFRSIFNGRRNASVQPQNTLPRAVWSEDNCKTLRRIVGGYTLESPEELPYMVFVDTGCGGAIVGNMWVLTAAHCIEKSNPKYVHVGSVELLGGCQYSVVDAYAHPRYASVTLRYDIALLRISPSFIFSPAVKPIRMSRRKARRKTCGIISGWGAEIYKGRPQYRLKMTMIPVVARRRCRMFGIKRGQFCAGYWDGSSDACQGDSGGPFVVNGILVGIISYGYKCAMPHTPGVYIDVSYYRKWIRWIAGI